MRHGPGPRATENPARRTGMTLPGGEPRAAAEAAREACQSRALWQLEVPADYLFQRTGDGTGRRLARIAGDRYQLQRLFDVGFRGADGGSSPDQRYFIFVHQQ